MFKDKIIAPFLYVLFWIVRGLIALRYRLEIIGLEKLTSDKFTRPGGIIFLPNHPAEIDPIIMEVVLWRKFKPRPLVVEHFYELKGFKIFMDLVNSLPLPTMDIYANKWRAKKVEKQFNTVVDEIRKKKNFLIYPSGRLKLTGLEMIGGASFVHKILEACPDTNIVLIRSTGLWGSQFSKALTGVSPDFGSVLWNCFKILLKNGIFFAPRRDVKIEIELPPSDFPYHAPRLEFNKYLENWYNRHPTPGPESIKLVSYSFYRQDFPKVMVSIGNTKATEERPVNAKVQQAIFEHLATLAGRPVDKIERKMHLSHDLGLDSLDIAQLYLFIDEHYNVKDLIPGDLHTVEDLLQAAAGYKKEREVPVRINTKKMSLPEEAARPDIAMPEGDTIQEVFLRSCERCGKAIACTDAVTGPMSYHKLKMASLLFSSKVKELPGDYVGILLPASVAANLVVMATLLAGKIPVMLNWTAGERSLDHAVNVTGLKKVITSQKFLGRIENGDFGKMEEMFLFLEDIKKSISLADKIKALLLSTLSASRLLKLLNLAKISENNPAVILFTSGTETLPKGVPLSHLNILSNQRASITCVKFLSTDTLYGTLPPFHSFGFSVTGIFPLLSALRVCYAPDPTDSHGMAQDIATWKPTLLFCAPSFIRGLFRIADPEKMQSLRLIVSGAEKTPEDLFSYVEKNLPNGCLMEGYGITECSPVVSIDRPTEKHKGVGKPIPGVEIKIVHPDTHQTLPQGEEGEILISGPNVFSGYLAYGKDPFITIDSKRWYDSGDRGKLDTDGTLLLLGRSKRFVKIGGEMVSLGGLEEEILRIAHSKQWINLEAEGPPLAISAKEKDGEKPMIVLFSTFSASKDEINESLKQSGHGSIVRITEVRQLDMIPLTGTGKTHYRHLDEMLNK